MTSPSFTTDIFAQVTHLEVIFSEIIKEYEGTEPSSFLSVVARLKTRELVSGLKYIFDQLTFRMWDVFVSPHLSEKGREKCHSRVYYPYLIDPEMFKSSLGQMIPKDEIAKIQTSEDMSLFVLWLQLSQPFTSETNRPMHLVCKIYRTVHQRLLLQSKSQIEYIVEAFSENGGGASMRFKEIPTQKFSIWTLASPDGATTGFGAPPVLKSDDTESKLAIFTFDPETMSFNDIPGGRTSVSQRLECRIDDLQIDALDLFSRALYQAQIEARNVAMFTGEDVPP